MRTNIGVQMYRFAFLHFPAFAVRTQSPYVCLSNVCLSEGVGKFYFFEGAEWLGLEADEVFLNSRISQRYKYEIW